MTTARTTACSWRAARPDELDALVAVVHASEEHDRTPLRTTREELAADLADPDVDTVVGERDGRVVACGLCVRPPEPGPAQHFAWLFAFVTPHARAVVGDELVLHLAERGEAFLRAQGHDRARALRTELTEWQTEDLQRWGRLGFTPVRVSLTMSQAVRRLSAIPRVVGVRIVGWRDDLGEAARLAHNAAFEDRWGSAPATAYAWRAGTVDSAQFRRDLSFLALTGSDEVVGYLIGAHYPDDEAVTGRREGWVDRVGVVGLWRRRGIASALLSRFLAGVADDPHLTHAGLEVDSQSLTGANELYERLGFRTLHRSVSVARPVR